MVQISTIYTSLKAYKTSNDNLAAIPSGIPETFQRLQNERCVDFILEIFELSGISNVGNWYQQI